MPEFFIPVKKLRRLFDEALPHPRQIENTRTVAELIADLQKSTDLADLRSLQQKLLKAVSEAEQEQRKATNEKKNLDQTREAVVKEGRKRGAVDKERLRELGRESDKVRLEIDVLKRVRRQLRMVGDGLLWKAVGLNRAYIYAVWDAPGGGNTSLSDPVGLAAELKAVEHFWKDKGALAVMHDLTNCGRVGDLTVVSPVETENIKIAEVKTASSIDSNQIERMEDLVRFTRGGPKTLENGYTVRASESPIPLTGLPKTGLDHMDVYGQAIRDADEQGIGWATIGNYLGLFAVAPVHPRWTPILTAEVSQDERERLFKEAFEPAYQELARTIMSREEAKVYLWDSAETQEDVLLGLPFSLYPFPPGICAALTCDYIKLMVYLNVSNIERLFKHRGFQVTSLDTPKDKHKRQFFWSVVLSKTKLTKDGWKVVYVHLNKPLWQQVMGEALSIEVLIQAVRHEMKGKIEGRGDVSLLFINSDGSLCKMVPSV